MEITGQLQRQVMKKKVSRLVRCSSGLTVLVDEHAERDAIGVKAVEEILDVAADERVEAKLLLVLDDSLRHRGNHVVVTVTHLDQELQEAEDRRSKSINMSTKQSIVDILKLL